MEIYSTKTSQDKTKPSELADLIQIQFMDFIIKIHLLNGFYLSTQRCEDIDAYTHSALVMLHNIKGHLYFVYMVVAANYFGAIVLIYII